MHLLHLLLGFDGRIGRLRYWLTAISMSFGLSLISTGLIAVAAAPGGDPNPIVFLPLGLVVLCAMWVGAATGVKRCHDRDKSGWFMLVGFIPLIGGLWLLVELGFLEGAPGPNRFGPATKPVPVGVAA